MISIKMVNPAKKTAILAIEVEGQKSRIVNVELLKFRATGGGVVTEAVVVGPYRYMPVVVNGATWNEKLPQTFVLPIAAVKAAIGQTKAVAM